MSVDDREDVRVDLEGEIDLERRDELHTRLRQAAASGAGDVVIDLRQVTFLDSSGLAAIADLSRLLTGTGRRVVLEGATGSVRRTLEIVGFGELADLR